MSKELQSERENPVTSLYHRSLIKMVVVTKLKNSWRSWEDFLIENFPGKETRFKGWKQLVGQSLKHRRKTLSQHSQMTPNATENLATPIFKTPQESTPYSNTMEEGTSSKTRRVNKKRNKQSRGSKDQPDPYDIVGSKGKEPTSKALEAHVGI